MTTTRLLRTFVVTVTLALGAAAALALASPAAAVTECGKKVLADWYDNGRIDRLYPLNCYEEAIDAIPSDIGPYVDAEEVITRALQGALRNDLVKGGCDPSADGSPDDCTNGSGSGGNGNGNGGKGNGGNGAGGNAGEVPGGGTGSGETPQAAPGVDTSGPSSVPIPLLVLGGMSIVLLAAGGLGYLSRRRAAASADDPSDFTL